ncbi:hypothetical protein [Microcoleus asticus]|uniref:Uncharacterized protein n=1 Tax=Microcoleus asticus IPMA8 TaxID=2563858 RepID=A0ABX2CT22_9CYAN|nr:hypothetical protein [Microcoleus asticus]NQE32837.1 hypothetical protein [Microcoleus asticus IPMA8]
MKTKDIVTDRAMACHPASYDYFGVEKRHCRLLNIRVVDGYMRSGPIDYFGVGKRHCRVLNSRVVDGYMRSG